MRELAKWFAAHGQGFTGRVLWHHPLAPYTYYRIGGPAWAIASPCTLEDLEILRRLLHETPVASFILGKGSNILVSDHGFAGLIIRTGALNTQASLISTERARTGGALGLHALLRKAAAEGWGGLEFLAGIPGSVGGAIAMNAGTHLGEAMQAARRVDTFELRGAGKQIIEGILPAGYRQNHFLKADEVIWSVDWQIQPQNPASVKARIDEVLVRRKSTQPIQAWSCGSVFRNPPELPAGALLERLGLKGHICGDAQFSEKHANFIVNRGRATALDVKTLIDLGRNLAWQRMKIRLEPEVILLGDFPA